VVSGTGPVRRFDRIEFALSGAVDARNPHDPAEAELTLECGRRMGRRSRPRVRVSAVERRTLSRVGRNGEWVYPSGRWQWRARYAPVAVGEHACRAVLRTPEWTGTSSWAGFVCVGSTNAGYVRVSPADPRYLELDNGAPYFAIGQNIAFVKELPVTLAMIRKLGANGANYARVWTCSEDWALALEARRSGWGRSWGWNPPFVSLPDRESYHDTRLCLRLDANAGSVRFDPCTPVALRPGTRYRFLAVVRTSGDATVRFDLGGPRSAGVGMEQDAIRVHCRHQRVVAQSSDVPARR